MLSCVCQVVLQDCLQPVQVPPSRESSVLRELKQRQPLSVHVQMCSRDLKQTTSVSVGSLFVLALTPVPCALCVDLSVKLWNSCGNCAGTSCYHLTGMEISMQNPQAVEVWFVNSLAKTCAENTSIATEWGWTADKQRRVSDPVCDVVHLCFSLWCSVNAHMAVTACSTVVKKYFQLKVLLYKNWKVF